MRTILFLALGGTLLLAQTACKRCCDSSLLTTAPVLRSAVQVSTGESMDDLVRRAMGSASTAADAGLAALALTGGGDQGAFGAGLLNGWTESGRPQFRIVTGVSTGALLATFAFLGTEYDQKLEEAYTTVKRSDILRDRLFFTVPFSNSLVRTDPLRRLIKKYIDDDVLDAVATEGQNDRVLLVGTLDLDRGALTIWDLTALAQSDCRDKGERYRQILLASATIPVLMEPVFIDDTMHVDGGAREQVFMRELIGSMGRAARQSGLIPGVESTQRPTVYVIANSKFGLKPICVQDHLLPIAFRSLSVLTEEALIGNIFRIYASTLLEGFEFRVAFIDPDIPTSPNSATFDPEIMRGLFEHGRAKGRDQQWSEKPPTVDDIEHAALQNALPPR